MGVGENRGGAWKCDEPSIKVVIRTSRAEISMSPETRLPRYLPTGACVSISLNLSPLSGDSVLDSMDGERNPRVRPHLSHWCGFCEGYLSLPKLPVPQRPVHLGSATATTVGRSDVVCCHTPDHRHGDIRRDAGPNMGGGKTGQGLGHRADGLRGVWTLVIPVIPHRGGFPCCRIVDKSGCRLLL